LVKQVVFIDHIPKTTLKIMKWRLFRYMRGGRKTHTRIRREKANIFGDGAISEARYVLKAKN